MKSEFFGIGWVCVFVLLGGIILFFSQPCRAEDQDTLALEGMNLQVKEKFQIPEIRLAAELSIDQVTEDFEKKMMDPPVGSAEETIQLLTTSSGDEREDFKLLAELEE